MSIEQSGVIDFISTNLTGDCCVVWISDHLEWNSLGHRLALQKKLNNYLSFIESGEIYETQPDAREQAIEIAIRCKFTPESEDDLGFLRFARKAIEGAGFRLSVWIDNVEFFLPNEA